MQSDGGLLLICFHVLEATPAVCRVMAEDDSRMGVLSDDDQGRAGRAAPGRAHRQGPLGADAKSPEPVLPERAIEPGAGALFTAVDTEQPMLGVMR